MIKEMRNNVVEHLKGKISAGYPATVAKYHDELFHIEEDILNLPAVLVKTGPGTFDFNKKYDHSVNLICIDINEAGKVDQMEAVEDLVDWVIANLPANHEFGSSYENYLTGDGQYQFVLVSETGKRPLVVGIITLKIGAEA